MRRTIYSKEQEQLVALLRQLRFDASLRQADLARKLRRPQSFVSKYETGQRRLDLVELRQICRALDVPLVEFVKRFEKAVGRPATAESQRRMRGRTSG